MIVLGMSAGVKEKTEVWLNPAQGGLACQPTAAIAAFING
jgi:hypothetical protein